MVKTMVKMMVKMMGKMMTETHLMIERFDYISIDLIIYIDYICDQICHKRSYTRTVSGLTIRQIQQYTNSSCLYHCQIFNGLLLLRPHSRACLASTDARVVCKWLQLARPGRQPAGNHYRTDW